MIKDIVIIGGGISGLATAYFLKDISLKKALSTDLLLLEKSNRLGGCIQTEYIDGFTIESGPDCFISEKPWALSLCRRIGLEEKLLYTNEEKKGVHILWKKKLHKLPEGVILMIPTKIMPFISTSLLSFKGKLRAGIEPFIPKRETDEDESLASFIRRRLGEEVLIRIAEPLVAGIHAGDPETMSLKSTFPRFLEIEKKYGSLIRGMLALKREILFHKNEKSMSRPAPTFFVTLKGGLSELVFRLKELIGENSIQTGSCVTNIRKIPDKQTWEVILDSGDKILSKSVLLSTSAYVSAEIIYDLDSKLKDVLLSIPYVSTATVSLAFKKTNIPQVQNTFGFLIPFEEKHKIMACTFTSTKFRFRTPEDYSLVRCFLGGTHNPEITEKTEDKLIFIAFNELKEILKITAEPVLSRAYIWKKSITQYTLGHQEKLKTIDERVSQFKGLYLTGSAYRGIGISDCIHEAEITAEKIVKFLSY